MCHNAALFTFDRELSILGSALIGLFSWDVSSLGWLEFHVLRGGCFDELQDPMHWLKIKRLGSHFGMEYPLWHLQAYAQGKKGSSQGDTILVN